MRKTLIALAALMAAGAVSAQTYVAPHVRKDGTYVQGHYRSAPNSTKLDNYSTKGNTNPYTGRQGTVDPYKAPDYSSTNRGRQQNSYTYKPYSSTLNSDDE